MYESIIPDQLRKQLFIKTYNKIPTEGCWTLDPSLYTFNENKKEWINILTKSPYIDPKTRLPYNSEKRNNYYKDELDLKYDNYGVLCGYNGLVVVDIDIPELDVFLHTIPEFQETFAVRTANSQLTHFYFYCKDNKHPPIIRVNNSSLEKDNRICDIQGVGTQVIGPGSKIKCKDGNIREYKVISNNQIKYITYEKITSILEEFSKKYKIPIKILSSDNANKKENITNVTEFIEKDPVCKSIKDKLKIKDLLNIWGIDTSINPCESPFTQESKNRASISFTDHTFNDFHTLKSGSIFDLFMEYNKVDFATAKYQLGLIAGIDVDDFEFISDNYKFFYFVGNNLQKFCVINLKNKAISIMRKNEIIDYMVYTTPIIYESLGINTKNIQKKRNQLTEKVFSYMEIENNIEVLIDFGYSPTNEMIFEHNSKKYLNQYVAPKLHNLEILQNANPTMFPNINHIIQHLCKYDEVIYNYFLDWLAFQLQYPLQKLPTSFIFMGAHGTGKGILKMFVLQYIFGEENVNEITQSTIVRSWGDWMVKSRIIFADEINLHAKQHEEVCDRLKNITTNPFITVDIKRKDSLKMQNFTHWIFTSNKELPFQIEEGDRRYIVVEQLNKLDVTYVENIDPKINKIQHDKEILAFYSHLVRRSPTFKSLAKPLHTEEKQNLIAASYSNTKKFIEDIRSYDSLNDFLSDLQYKIHIVDNFVTARDFYSLFKRWCETNSMIAANKINFGRELTRVCDIKSYTKRMLDVVSRGYNLDEVLGRNTSPEDIKTVPTNDSTDELSKDLKEFQL